MPPREPDNPKITGVVVEPDICCRFMNCVRIAGRAFRMDRATGKSSPARWQDVDPALLWQASRSCPTGAIRIITDEGYVVPRWQETDSWSMDKHPAAARPHDKARDRYQGMT